MASTTTPAPSTVAPEGAVLTAEGLAAGYGEVPAIQDIHFHVSPGEVVAILGANASGKSTTLLALVGLLEPMASIDG